MQQKQEVTLEENNNWKKKGRGEHGVLKLPIDKLHNLNKTAMLRSYTRFNWNVLFQ